MKFKVTELYYIEWLDHCSDAMNWTSERGENMEPCLIMTTGFVLKDDEKYVVLAMNYDKRTPKGSMVSGRMTILKNCIKKRKKLTI